MKGKKTIFFSASLTFRSTFIEWAFSLYSFVFLFFLIRCFFSQLELLLLSLRILQIGRIHLLERYTFFIQHCIKWYRFSNENLFYTMEAMHFLITNMCDENTKKTTEKSVQREMEHETKLMKLLGSDIFNFR